MGDVGGEADRDARLGVEQRIALGERVGQWEEQQSGVAGADLGAERIERLGDVRAQVAVGEHATLRTSRGTGGVDDRGDRVDVEIRDPPIDRRVIDGDSTRRELLQRAGVDDEDLAARREVGAEGFDDVRHRTRLDDRHHRLAVAHDPTDLLGRRRVVDRHRHPAGRQDRVVEEHPLQAGV